MGEKQSRGWRGIMLPRSAAGVLLLMLTVHAVVASATHFHVSASSGAATSRGALARGDEGARGVPPAGDDAQCLLCRLQRNFVSGVRHATPALAPLTARPLEHEPPRDTSARAARTLLRSGRAPPLA